MVPTVWAPRFWLQIAFHAAVSFCWMRRWSQRVDMPLTRLDKIFFFFFLLLFLSAFKMNNSHAIRSDLMQNSNHRRFLMTPNISRFTSQFPFVTRFSKITATFIKFDTNFKTTAQYISLILCGRCKCKWLKIIRRNNRYREKKAWTPFVSFNPFHFNDFTHNGNGWINAREKKKRWKTISDCVSEIGYLFSIISIVKIYLSIWVQSHFDLCTISFHLPMISEHYYYNSSVENRSFSYLIHNSLLHFFLNNFFLHKQNMNLRISYNKSCYWHTILYSSMSSFLFYSIYINKYVDII